MTSPGRMAVLPRSMSARRPFGSTATMRSPAMVTVPPGRGGLLTGSTQRAVTVQVGASLAKQMFAAVGPQGAAALRLTFASLILLLLVRPWRGRLGPVCRMSGGRRSGRS